MKKTKKMMALALAVSLVLGNSVVALAADNEGSTTGTGTSEGHVEQKKTNVILPTVTAGSSLFSYTMDPERLIQGTDAAKYAEGTKFPAKDADTGVYFLTDANTYANTSKNYQVVNKSSCDVVVTVKVQAEATTGSTDIALVADSALATATDPSLYLGLNVGSAIQEVSTTEAIVKKTISGTPTNFAIGVKDNSGTKSYVYEEKADASSWKAMNISLTGKVNDKAIAATTTAPSVKVTWSWAEKTETDAAAVDADMVNFVEGPQISMNNDGLITMTGFTAEQNYVSLAVTDGEGTKWDIGDSPYTWDLTNYNASTGGNANIQLSDRWKNFLIEKGGDVILELTLTDGTVKRFTTTIS